MAEKVTKMRLKVDLKCSRCYNKVRKLLCKIPQIRDQVYDDKNNTVTIIVACCSPEKIQQKLCYKADGAIASIEIVKETKTVEKPKAVTFSEKPPAPKPAPKPAQVPKLAPADDKPKPAPVDAAPKLKPALKQTLKPAGYPSVAAYRVGVTDAACYYVGVPGGSYYGGGPPEYGYPAYGTPVYDSYGGGGYNNYQREYSSEEHPQECAIM